MVTGPAWVLPGPFGPECQGVLQRACLRLARQARACVSACLSACVRTCVCVRVCVPVCGGGVGAGLGLGPAGDLEDLSSSLSLETGLGA